MTNNKYNLAVIGGGPAGMIAAGRAGELGARVILVEKNQKLGRKLLMTGKGRCNITNAEEDVKKFVSVYGRNGKFLHSAFNKFSNRNIVEFFESNGIKTKVERGNRVFPVSDSAKDVLDCLKNYMADGDVELKLDSPVRKIVIGDKAKNHLNNPTDNFCMLQNGEKIFADKFVIATGGMSYPITGSTGDGYGWLKKLGHTTVEPTPSLTPIIVKEGFVKQLEGLSLKNVEISLWDQNHKVDSRFGEALFTGHGLSGPIILDLSRTISGNANPPSLPPSPRLRRLKKLWRTRIDFKPALDYPTLDKRIQRDFDEQKNKQFKNSLDKLLPQTLIPVIIELSGINPEKQVNEVTKVERKKIVKLLKEFEFHFKRLAGFEKAIITSGGVNLKEVDPKTMQSKIIDNLYFAGEILDVDGPTGGYNLQVAWSTGYLAGESVK